MIGIVCLVRFEFWIKLCKIIGHNYVPNDSWFQACFILYFIFFFCQISIHNWRSHTNFDFKKNQALSLVDMIRPMIINWLRFKFSLVQSLSLLFHISDAFFYLFIYFCISFLLCCKWICSYVTYQKYNYSFGMCVFFFIIC